MSFKDQVEEYFSSATVFSDGLFHGKTILVTGGSGGIGLAVGSLLVRLGANLVIAARKEGRLADITSVLRELSGSKISYFVSDIRKIDEVEAMFEQFSNEKLDAVVNCAGGQFPQPAIDFRRKGWEAVVDTNLNGSWNLMSTAARHWEKRDEGGNIVNVVVVNQGLFGVAHTSAARAGVIAFSEKAAVEWAPLGIRVNCVAPGAIRTEGWKVYPPEVSACYSKTNPLMRAGKPMEVAEAISFLCSSAGNFINGETLFVDGGGRHWGEIWTTGKPDYYLAASKFWDK